MNATSEQWRPVVGYEGSYEVSDLGRVRSIDRIVQHRGSVRRKRLHRGRVLRPGPGRGGYLRVILTSPGVREARSVHRLALESFAGAPPSGTEACHRNGDKADNRIENLYWGTKSQNMNDKVLHGVHHEAKKTRCPYGHEYDYVYFTQRGGMKRGCKRCRRESNQRRTDRLSGGMQT